MNLLLVDDEIAMLHIMEKAIDWKKKGIQKVFTAYNTDLARDREWSESDSMDSGYVS